ncbi:MAG: hypothetical protein R3E83_07065 [Burkholderiaceae bacterium]
MSNTRTQVIGNLALGLSLLTFAVFFLNVLIGGPLGKPAWMSDITEMLTLFAAVVLFVIGTIARESNQSAGR